MEQKSNNLDNIETMPTPEPPFDRRQSERGKTSNTDAFLTLGALVRKALDKDASDIHLKTDSLPVFRLDGVLVRQIGEPVFDHAQMELLARKMMDRPEQHDTLQQKRQLDLSFSLENVGRMRVNIFYQSGSLAMALRIIRTIIPTPEELFLPDMVKNFVHLERGMVLMTGATGSGKSTTLAALMNEINKLYSKHILTIEDPVEYIFTEAKSMVNQRELGIDAVSYPEALRSALREDPDVILMGEMRDPESIEVALTAAETGHLVFTTLHAPAAAETVDRIISSFSGPSQATIRSKLAHNLKAVISQRLIPSEDGGRIAACEVMTTSALIREMILDPIKIKEINDLIVAGKESEGMLSFDESLFRLVKQKKISRNTALRYASSVTNLRLKLDGF